MNSTNQLQLVPIPIESTTTNFSNRGLLTSQYKEEVRENFRHLQSNSLFGLKQKVKTNHHRFMPTVGTILKVSVFVIAYLIAYV